MSRNSMNGLPRALLAKWATPFDEATKKLQSFLPLGAFPNHLTKEKCIHLHTIYRDGIDQTEKTEAILAARIKALKRKCARSSDGKKDAVGWIRPSGSGNSRSADTGKDKKPQQPQQQKQQKKDRARASGSAGQGQPNKRRKRSSGKDDKRSSQHLPAWVTRTPKAGDQVAAKVDDEALWILATVEKHNEKKGLFIVVDEDAGEGKRRDIHPYRLKRRSILALPRPEEASGAIFPLGLKVMTLYPNTTTFYPATISGPPIKGKDGGPDCCVVQFHDDDLKDGGLPTYTLPSRYVRYPAET